MQKKITLLILFISISINFFGQEKIKGNKNVTIVNTKINSFNKIIFGEKFEIVLSKSENNSVEIETDENLHDVIEFNVIDSTLTFNTNKKIRSKKKLNITVYYTNNLQEIELFEDAEIESLNTINVAALALKINDYAKADLSIKSDEFKLYNNNRSRIQLRSKTKLNVDSPITNLSLNESSNTDIIIRTDSLTVKMKERATISLEGSANYVNVSTVESTDFIGKNFNVKECILIAKDNSEFSIQCIDNITIEASEKSKTELFGNPKIILSKFTNSAKLLKKEL